MWPLIMENVQSIIAGRKTKYFVGKKHIVKLCVVFLMVSFYIKGERESDQPKAQKNSELQVRI